MARYAWSCKVVPGRMEEWKYRHDNLWPEMAKELKAAGIRNYSIWMKGDDELFGYYECDDVTFTTRYQAESEIVKIWDMHVRDVVTMEMDPVTGAQPALVEGFYFE